jgi:TPR repeat protein
VARDSAEAVRWYRLAAAQDHAEAQNDLAVIYDAGDGVAEDDAEALRWYRRAAAGGNPSAQYNLGLMYANGEGVRRDRARAYLWLSVAAAESGGTTGGEALERVAGSLSPAARAAGDRLVATCRKTAFKDCGEPTAP